ncbi:MAG: succinate dehydrogenase [Pseudomonadota bacterium]
MKAARLYVAQRLTAALMAPLVIGHLAVMFYATSNGLSAADILGRTSGSVGWALFYGVFAVAVAVHAAIGLRAISIEWAGASEQAADGLMLISGSVLALLGLRAVAAVVFPGAL